MLGAGLDIAPTAARTARASYTLDPENLLLQPDSFGVAPWGAGSGGAASVSAGAVTAPSGGVADTLEDSNAAALVGRSQAVAITSGAAVYAGSLYLKSGTSAAASLRLSLLGGAGVTAEGVIDLASGATQWRTGVVGTSVSSSAIGGGWWRLLVRITDNSSGNTSLSFEARPAFAAAYAAAPAAAALGTAHAWHAQLVLEV